MVVKVTALQGTGQGNLQLFPGGSTASAGILLRRPQTRAPPSRSPRPGGAISILPYVAGNGTVQAAVEVDAYNP